MKTMLKTLTLFFLALSPSHSEDTPAKAVYDLTTGSTAIFKSRLFGGITSTTEHYSNDLRDFKAAVVIHGKAYKFFLKEPEKENFHNDKALEMHAKSIKREILTLRETYDVEFLVCGAGLWARGYTEEDLYDFVKVMPNAMIPLIDKQNQGFAYIPVFDHILPRQKSFFDYIKAHFK